MSEVELELEFEPESSAVVASGELAIEPDHSLEVEIEAEPAQAAEDETAGTALISRALVEVLPADFELPVLAKFIPNRALLTAVTDATQALLAVEVKGEDGLKAADAALGVVNARLKDIDAHFEEPARVAHELHRGITGTRAAWKREGVEAVAAVGRLMFAETQRLDAEARERARLAQEAEDAKAREAAKREAEEAAKADVPAPIVEALQEQARTATAAPVARPVRVARDLANTALKRTWKARLIGTPTTDEPNPSTAEMSPAQRVQTMVLLKAILDGRAAITCIEINWSNLNKRAAADKTAMGIPGLEAFQTGGMRAKGGRG